jgi:heme A synthase
VLDKRDPNRHARGVTVLARLFAVAGLGLLFVGFPVAAYAVVGHWLAPVIVFVVACICVRVVAGDWT